MLDYSTEMQKELISELKIDNLGLTNMQAYLQYRRMGQAVQKQIDEYPELKQLEKTPAPEPSAESEADVDAAPEGKPLDVDESRPLPPGITLQNRIDGNTGAPTQVYLVGWTDENDPLNPLNYTLSARLAATLNITALAFIVGAASSIESGVLPQNAAAYGVSDVVASLATGIYLLGFGTGSLVSGPLSEILGRNAVYAGSLTLFMIFVMATGLAPNIGAQLAFRFLAGIFGCPPLTCAGGTVADLWRPLEKTLIFPMYAILSFGGPVLGPVIASWMGQGVLSWRWTSWIILIASGLIMGTIILFQPETYSQLILKWKAHQLRVRTGNQGFRSEMDLEKTAVLSRMAVAGLREFQLTVHEPIVLLISLYMTIIYIVLFTFFDGYEYIFMDVHGLSQGLKNIVWVAMYTGIMLVALLVPLVYRWTKREYQEAEAAVEVETGEKKAVQTRPENRLWFAMMGCPFIPIGLFWMGWTDYSSISVWSPIVASAVFGFGTISVFISSYMYVIDSYSIYAASALGFMTVSRYIAAGGMTVVGVPFYKNMGVQYTLTILACISAVMTPVPYVFYRYGPVIRGWSRYAKG